MKTRTTWQKLQTMDRALSESGCIAFAAIDQPLVTELCEIIGALYRIAESSQIESVLRDSLTRELTL